MRGADAPLTRNSLVLQDGGHLTTLGAGTPVRPPPGTPGWYWAGAGVVEGGKLLEFYHRFTGTSAWDFTEQAVAIATFGLPDLHFEGVGELPAALPGPGRSPIMWGSALLPAGPWTYIYGYRVHTDRMGNPKWLYVARAPRGRLGDLASWQYATGQGWSADPASAAERPTPVDTGFSVVKVGRLYALVTRRPSTALVDGVLMAYLAPDPAGPFRASQSAILYRAPEVRQGAYVYEARVHPELGDASAAIISYNVNSCGAPAGSNVSVYRPRFVRVPFALFRSGYHPPGQTPVVRTPNRRPYC
jgi:hypothetical protein